jgi:transcriptional regulator
MWSYDTSTIEVLGPEARMAEQTELLHGTLDTLILKTLSWGPRHGYGIARWIQDTTADALQIGEGSLYPALHRLEERGWVESSWQLSSTKRRTKVYRLTVKGRQQLRAEAGAWAQFAEAVGTVLRTEERPA